MTSVSKEWFRKLSTVQKRIFITIFCARLTIEARDPASDIAEIKRINDLNHKLLNQIIKLEKEDDSRYPDDMIFEWMYSFSIDKRIKLDEMINNSYFRVFFG